MKVFTLAGFALMTLFLVHSADARHRGGARGVPGVVTLVNGQYFMMDLDSGGYLKIGVSNNTRFELHGEPSDSTHVKKGARVRISGVTADGSVVDAYRVNVIREAGGGSDE